MEELKSVEILQWKGGGNVFVAINNAIVLTTSWDEGDALMKQEVREEMTRF